MSMKNKKQTTRKLYGKSKHKFENTPSTHQPLDIPKKYVSFSQPPEDIEEQNKLIMDMVEWADTDDKALDPDKFPVTRKLNPYRFYRLADKNEFFAEGLSLAKYIIGVRLKEHARERKLDKEYLFRFLPLYHPEFREWMREKKLSMFGDDKPTEITVNVAAIPSSPIVKNKEE